MLKDEKREYNTAKYPAPAGYEGCTIQWEARMDKHGTQDAYFAITGEIWSPSRRDDCEACGCLHGGYIDKTPLAGRDAMLPGLVRWHLTSVRQGPMHYAANSLFHLKEGKVDFFKKSCVFGALEDDALPYETENAKEYIARHANPEAAVAEVTKKWLEDRFPRLMEAFERDMVAFFGEDVRC